VSLAAQFLAHLVGDYLLQSHWMATEKTKRSAPAVIHALLYGLPFLVLRPSALAWLVIVDTHFVIDRWRLARYVAWFKNLAGPRRTHAPWPAQVGDTGYSADLPPWLAGWLLIITDNTVHLLINAAAFAWL
jgi:hypothetical protein